MKIAVIGSGLIGRSWSLIFALGGHDVRLYDPDADALACAGQRIAAALQSMAASGLCTPGAAQAAAERVSVAQTLEDAVADAAYLQESTPERLEVKQQVFRMLDEATSPDCVLASSTSGFPASAFTDALAGRERCVVAHPVNPPHLIPLVEIVPAPWTRAEVVERTRELMAAIGQSPIVLKEEVRGFVLNRLQGALLNEALRLIEDGVCGASEIDAAVRDGLARRWVFMGPMETIDLNAPGGVRDYAARYAGLYQAMAEEERKPLNWNAPLVDRVAREVEANVAGATREARSSERDRRLARVARFMGQFESN